MADQGKNEAAKSLLDLQPTTVLELYKLHADFQNRPEIFFTFHGGTNFSNNITWQGIQYIPLPVETEGFGVFADGTLPRPKIRVGNHNKIVTVFLEKFSDFKNAAVFRKKVFLKHLDDVNFDGGNPFGVANPSAEISEEKYFIGQKTIENSNYVEFELNSPLDLDNFKVNERTVSAKYCHWQYRGLGCQYAGKPIEKANGLPFTNTNDEVVPVITNDEFASENLIYSVSESYSAGDIVFIENRKVIIGRANTSDAPIFHKTYYVCVSDNDSSNPQHPEGNKSFWQKDGCTKKIGACQKRFAANSSFLRRVFLGDGGEKTFKYIHNNTDNPLSFLTKNAKIAGTVSPLTYEGEGEKFTILYTLRKNDFSSIENIESADQKTVDETIFATTKLTRDTDNFTVETTAPYGFSMAYTKMNNPHSRNMNLRQDRLNFLHEGFLGEKVNNIPQTLTVGEFQRRGANNVLLKDSFNTQIIGVNTIGPKRLTTKLNMAVNVDGELQSLMGDAGENGFGPLYSYQGEQTVPNADFFSIFGDSETIVADNNAASNKQVSSFQGDIAQVCIWNRKLNNEERTLLYNTNLISTQENTVNDNGNQILASNFNKGMGMPISYAECTGELASLTGNGLVAWYDMETGFLDVSGNVVASSDVTGLLDEHTGEIHLSGYGENGFEQREVTYNSAKFSANVPNQTKAFTLPFGGFPGTDGYNYESRGTS